MDTSPILNGPRSFVHLQFRQMNHLSLSFSSTSQGTPLDCYMDWCKTRTTAILIGMAGAGDLEYNHQHQEADVCHSASPV